MFSASQVIARPQTQESAPSLGGDPLDRRPSRGSARRRRGRRRRGSISPDLKRLTRSASERQSERNWSRCSSRWSPTSSSCSVRQVHRILDAERQRGLGDRGQRVVALERDAVGETAGRRGRRRSRRAGRLVGVVDQALRAGARAARPAPRRPRARRRSREGEAVPVGDAAGSIGRSRLRARQGRHLVEADLDDVGLEAAGHLRRGLLVGAEAGGLQLEVGVRLAEGVEQLVGDRVLVGEDAAARR